MQDTSHGTTNGENQMILQDYRDLKVPEDQTVVTKAVQYFQRQIQQNLCLIG